MTSSSERVLRSAPVSLRHYRVGEALRGISKPIDPRPHSVREVEEEYKQKFSRLQESKQSELEAAYQSGYQDGAAMARDDAQREIKRLGEWLRNLATGIANARGEWFAANERQVLELTCAMLEQILGDRPAVYERIHHALEQAFEQLAGGDRVTIRCHPNDLAFVQKVLSSDLEELAGFKRLRIIPDEQVGVNGCLVETELGIVDARIEQQLSILRGALLDAAPSVGESAIPTPVGDFAVPGREDG